MILYFFIASILYIPIRIILFFIIQRFGKFTYNNFSAFGFSYDSDDNTFYSTREAWQKEFGYCHMYDVAAPFFQIIIDTEPIKFFYNNKNWLITFWKGQYGITTGAEIGIYNTTQIQPSKKTIYFPATNEEMLDMSFTLYKKKEKLIQVKANHWWLATFKLGMFSKLKDLKMDIKIDFPNQEMLDAFIKSFRKKYKKKDYNVDNLTFTFTYKKPKTYKLSRLKISNHIRQRINYKNVKIYNDYIGDFFDNTENKKQIEVEKLIPDILKNKEDKNKSVIFLNEIVYSNLKDE